MRIFLSSLALVALVACGRDAVDVTSQPAPAAAPIPARTLRPPTPEEIAARETQALEGRPEITEQVEEPDDHFMGEVGDPAEEKRRMTEAARTARARAQAERAAGEARTPVQGNSSTSSGGGTTGRAPATTVPANGTPTTYAGLTARQLNLETPSFEVRTTPCYGDCAQYTFRLLPGDRAYLIGKKNTRQAGPQVRDLSEEEARELRLLYESTMTLELYTLYPRDEEAPADAPATVFAYNDYQGKQQNITVYYDAPAELQQLIDRVDRMARGTGWTVIKP